MTERSGDLSGKQDTLFNNYQPLSELVCQSSGVRSSREKYFFPPDFILGRLKPFKTRLDAFDLHF